MARLILLVILGVVTMAYFPESRAVLLDAAEPVITPALRWHSSHEMEEVVRELKLYERENYGRLPESRRFPDWLLTNFEPGTATDPWGGRYVLYEMRDSFAVVSFGPDRLPNTPDDLRMATIKERPGRR